LLQEATVSHLVERFSKAVSGYVLSTHVLEHDIPVLNPILDVVVININMFSALVVALA
jgi:hypothetical protein